MNTYAKERIIVHYHALLQARGFFCGIYSKIATLLLRENIVRDRYFVRRTVKTYVSCGKIYRDNKGIHNRISGNQHIRSRIDNYMKESDEMTTKSVQSRLSREGHDISLTTICTIRQRLGWTLKGTRYCQMIRHANKPKRVQWVQDNNNDRFEDVIWWDETSVWLEQHAKRCYRKKGVTPKKKPKPKYPLKLHVWAGISRRGPTKVCIFNSIMNADLYVDILEQTLIPFIADTYPDHHRFMQDNDPKHRSRKAQKFFEDNNINCWKTPAGKHA